MCVIISNESGIARIIFIIFFKKVLTYSLNRVKWESMRYIRNNRKVQYVSQEELRAEMAYYKGVAKEYISCGSYPYNKTNLTAWKYMMKILGFKIKEK